MARTLLPNPVTSEALFAEEGSLITKLVVAEQEDLTYGEVIFPCVVGADASAGINFTVPFDMVITNIEAQCTVANASGTLTLRRLTTALSGAAVCAVDATVTPTTLVTALTALTKGETLNVISIGGTAAATRGILNVKGRRV
jgi:hypothetical protein